jgi:hypothetical protein
MNQRIQTLIEQVGTDVSGKWISVDDAETLAEAIIRECCIALQPALRDMISRGQGVDLIKLHFGMNPNEITTAMLDRSIAQMEKQLAEQKPGWVCSKCGVDRIQDVCPKGDTAALTGECPMTGKALLRS